MNVSFLSTLYFPDEDTRRRLEFYQEQFDLFRAELAFRTRDLPPYQMKLQKEISHNNIRDTWKVIQGEKVVSKEG
jgi:hypothetical protein